MKDRTTRERLPSRRKANTQKATINGHDGSGTFYLTFGEYADGRLGEIFIEAYKEGTFSRGALDALGRMVSVALQYGTPPEAVVKALRFSNFPPRGVVEGSERVDFAHSVVDWIAQEIEQWYVPEDRRGPRSNPDSAPRPSYNPSEGSDDDQAAETVLALGDTSVSHVAPRTTGRGPAFVPPKEVTQYTGDVCENCNAATVKRVGPCTRCDTCGANSGCS